MYVYVSACMYVCMYICVYIPMCVYVCTYIYIHTHTFLGGSGRKASAVQQADKTDTYALHGARFLG